MAEFKMATTLGYLSDLETNNTYYYQIVDGEKKKQEMELIPINYLEYFKIRGYSAKKALEIIEEEELDPNSTADYLVSLQLEAGGIYSYQGVAEFYFLELPGEFDWVKLNIETLKHKYGMSKLPGITPDFIFSVYSLDEETDDLGMILQVAEVFCPTNEMAFYDLYYR